ncbi:MAG: ribosome recycling factor [Clostridia bacterium]|jgi:ribosome recycling factor|nr:ribosome recycling factor [Clostridia bacterium]
MLLNTKDFEEKMKKSISAYESELATISAGRANPQILDKITVECYGMETPVNQVATVKLPDARTIVIQPYDASMLKAIEKAIQVSDLGLVPQNDGKVIRISFPQPTEERRRELTKQVSKLAENAKVALRNIRRDANDKAKDMAKKKEMTEDEQKISEKNVQDLTEKYTKEIDVITDKKNKEIMAI